MRFRHSFEHPGSARSVRVKDKGHPDPDSNHPPDDEQGRETNAQCSKRICHAASASASCFFAQIAACVRFWTWSLRKIALTWTFTVASAIPIFWAMLLLE